MRHRSVLFLALGLTASVGCGDDGRSDTGTGDTGTAGDTGTTGDTGTDERPLFMILQYQVSCRNTGGCSGIPPRQIETLDGEAGQSINCSVDAADGSYNLNVTLDHPSGDPVDDFGFSIRNAVVSMGGGPATGGQLELTEQGSTFAGPVGGSPPSATCSDDPPTSCPIPCHLYDIVFEDTDNGPAVRGRIQCEGLPLGADPMVTRELHFPTDRSMPGTFLVENCEGL
jgi:hypothetical protein